MLQIEYILFGLISIHFNSDIKQFDCRGHREHMRNMDRMFQDPFGMFGGHPMLQGPGRSDPQRGTRAVTQWNPAEMSPFGFGNMFGSMFMNMNGMMSNMERSFVSTLCKVGYHLIFPTTRRCGRLVELLIFGQNFNKIRIRTSRSILYNQIKLLKIIILAFQILFENL